MATTKRNTKKPAAKPRTKEDIIADVRTSHHKDHFVASDAVLLDHYGSLNVTLERMLRQADNEPAVIYNDKGMPQSNPFFTSISRLEKATADLAAKLRICPSARTRAGRHALPVPETPRPRQSERQRLGLFGGSRRRNGAQENGHDE